jgi:hypothetical protein
VSLHLNFEEAASFATAVGVCERLACRKAVLEGGLTPAFGRRWRRWQVVDLIPGIRELGLIVEWGVMGGWIFVSRLDILIAFCCDRTAEKGPKIEWRCPCHEDHAAAGLAR